jgi:hypothetical protein
MKDRTMKDISSRGLFVAALFTFGIVACGGEVEPQSSDEVDSLNAGKAHDGGGQIPDSGEQGLDSGGGQTPDSGGGQIPDAGPNHDGGGGGGGQQDSGAFECNRASDCTGPVPQWCTECDAGNGGTTESCAHNACVHHRCEIVICQ